VRRWQRIALMVVYWIAVLALSVALLVALVLLIESRDQSSVEDEQDAGLLLRNL
jgi:hypothetical protein